MSQSGLFFLFLFFLNTNFTDKTVGFIGIRTRIDGEEGEHADHRGWPRLLLLLKCIEIKILFREMLKYENFS